MARVRRLLGWSIFLGLLWAVGVGVFEFVRYWPRCEIESPSAPFQFSQDGSHFFTLKSTNSGFGLGPLRVWDCNSESSIRELLGDVMLVGRTVGAIEFSNDGRRLAASLGDRSARLVDWRAGQVWRIDVPCVQELSFSPQGRWLLIGGSRDKHKLDGKPLLGNPPPEMHFVLDIATRQIVLELDASFAQFSKDERRLFVRKPNEPGIGVWDLDSCKQLALLPTQADEMLVSEDGSALACWRTGKSSVELWDLATFTRRFRRDLGVDGKIRATLSPNGATLALWPLWLWSRSNLEMIDARTGRLLWIHPMRIGNSCEFSPDGAYCCFFEIYPRLWEFEKISTIFHVASGRIQWTAKGWAQWTDNLLLYQAQPDHPMQLIEPRSGKLLAAPALHMYRHATGPIQTRDGRRVLVMGTKATETAFPLKLWQKWWPGRFREQASTVVVPTVVILDAATGRQLYRLTGYGRAYCSLSEDGGTFITVDEILGGFAVRVWDVDVSATRAYLWAIGAAAGAAIVLLGLRLTWGKLTRRSTSVE